MTTRRKNNTLTWERVNNLFTYDTVRGCLLNAAGTRQGYRDKTSQYWRLNIDGKMFQEHRVIFFLVHKKWPEPECDHRDRNRQNNMINNLRAASFSLNRHNRKSTGVRKRYNGKYEARISIGGRSKYLGVFPLKREAAKAYRDAASLYYGERAS